MQAVPAILIFTVLSLVMVLIVTYFVAEAKKRMGIVLLYLLISGIFIGIVGIRASSLDNPFYLYVIVMIWNLIFGVIHYYLSRKLLIWPQKALFGWNLLFAGAIVFMGFAWLLTFLKWDEYDLMIYYNFSATLTFFIPMLLWYSFECYTNIPEKKFLPKNIWVYSKNSELQFRGDDISHFFVVKYRLAAYSGGEVIDSLPMRAPGHIRLGEYFNSTLECYKMTQGRYSIEVKDPNNNYLGWYFFLSDGKGVEVLLDPGKTLLECGFTNPVYFGNSNPEEIENTTNKADREGKAYLIICKRVLEYQNQLLQS
jgi:hypothetical protein